MTLSLFPTCKLFVARLESEDGSIIGCRAGLVERELTGTGEVERRVLMDTDCAVTRVEVFDLLLGFLEDVSEERY